MRERWHLIKIRDKEHSGYMNSMIKARDKKVGHNLHIMTKLDPMLEIRQRAGPRHRVHSSHPYNLQHHCDLSWTPFPLLILVPFTSHFTDLVNTFQKSRSTNL